MHPVSCVGTSCSGGVLGLREQKKRAKLERLEAEGLRLFLEDGYDRASIEQIASSAGVARGTFYLYFKDKHALFAALRDRWAEVVLGLLDDVAHALEGAQTVEECIAIYRGLGTGLVLVGLANRDEILLTFRESRRAGEAGEGLRAIEVAILDKVTAFTEDVSKRGLLNIENPRLWCIIVFGAVERLFYETLLEADLGDPDLLAEQVIKMLASGMGVTIKSPTG